MRSSTSRGLGALLLSLADCTSDLGACDEAEARRIVFTDDEAGSPAYAGQALIHQSCGEGAFCHSPDIPAADRYGAPAGLDFDLSLATDAPSVERLRRGQLELYRHRELAMRTVERGTMPPSGVGREVVDAATRYRNLPAIDTPEGRAILRNWLACGAPVVERTAEDRPADVAPVGTVVPPAPRGDCVDGEVACASGCTDLSTDPGSCGACGLACTSGASCAGGLCSGCREGLATCADGCVDVTSDGRNCGSCGTVCGNGEVCARGVCSSEGCPAGTTACEGSCVDLQTNAASCGECGRACAAGDTCVAGTCDCGDTTSDPTNCGACGNVCEPGLACVSGRCECAAGTTLCDGACTDTSRDSANCAGCGTRCGAGESCAGGVCQRCGEGVSFAADVQPIFTASCGGSTCHSGARPSAGLDLTAGRAHGALVGVAAFQCASRLRVAPGDPDGSYLMAKLLGVDMCRGNRMPKAEESLTAEELDLVRDWICGGARND